MNKTPHIMIAEARFYDDISDLLLQGAVKAAEEAGATYEVFTLPGALEIPGAIKQASLSNRFDMFVALGCVIRGETYHFEVVSNESARGIMDLTINNDLIIGNGILTCETHNQAVERARPDHGNKGAHAVMAALALMEVKTRARAGETRKLANAKK